MGTSQSSSGSPSGVPLVPPWVPDPVQPDGQDVDGQDAQDGQDGNSENQSAPSFQPTLPISPPALAPAGRFGPARTSLGRFARSGSADDMRRGVGHYFGKGLGGGGSATQRFGGATRTAGSLYGVLSSAAAGQTTEPGSPFDPALLSGRSADEVMDAVVEIVRPVDGTQDAEASRNAIRTALSELLDRFPDADLLNLSEDQRLFVIERYLALDVYNRIRLDVGKAIQDKAPSVVAALSRMRQIRDYVRETIASHFRALFTSGQSLNARRIAQMGTQALHEAFEVFEEYVR